MAPQLCPIAHWLPSDLTATCVLSAYPLRDRRTPNAREKARPPVAVDVTAATAGRSGAPARQVQTARSGRLKLPAGEVEPRICQTRQQRSRQLRERSERGVLRSPAHKRSADSGHGRASKRLGLLCRAHSLRPPVWHWSSGWDAPGDRMEKIQCRRSLAPSLPAPSA